MKVLSITPRKPTHIQTNQDTASEEIELLIADSFDITTWTV